MISTTGILAISAMLLGSAVDVRSATRCPSADDVRVRLGPLLPQATDATEPAHVAQIDIAEGGDDGTAALRLRLLRADGYVIGERSVTLHGSCQEMAEAVATIIAAWETSPVLSEPPKAETAEPLVPPSVSPLPVPVQAPRPPPAFQLFVGAGGGAALVGGVAASGGLELSFGRATSRWQFRLGATTQSTRRFDLGNGRVDWQHTTLAAGLVLRTRHPVWLLSADAGPAIGWATLAGSGFATNRQQRSFEYGGTGGLRAGRRLGRLILWADCRLYFWAEGQQARVTVAGSTNSRDLSPIDFTASVGLSVLII